MDDVTTPAEQAHAALIRKTERGMKSRKLWIGIAGAVLPVAAQLATGAVGWPMAVGSATAAIVGYLLSQAHVDGKNADALAQVAGGVARAVANKAAP